MMMDLWSWQWDCCHPLKQGNEKEKGVQPDESGKRDWSLWSGFLVGHKQDGESALNSVCIGTRVVGGWSPPNRQWHPAMVTATLIVILVHGACILRQAYDAQLTVMKSVHKTDLPPLSAAPAISLLVAKSTSSHVLLCGCSSMQYAIAFPPSPFSKQSTCPSLVVAQWQAKRTAALLRVLLWILRGHHDGGDEMMLNTNPTALTTQLHAIAIHIFAKAIRHFTHHT